MSKKLPSNYNSMQEARDPVSALFEYGDNVSPDMDISILKYASYSSLRIGCTNEDSKNYSSLAELDNGGVV